MSLEEELQRAATDEDAERRHTDLVQALARTQRQLARAKARTNDLVAATVDACRDAIVGQGPLAIQAPKRDRRIGSGEHALWHLTDWQGAKVTTSYNSDVMRERVWRFVHKAAKITDIQRAAHPVRDVTIMLGGDMIEGLFNYPTQPYEIDATLFGQYVSVSKLLTEVVAAALETHEHVTVVAEWGNHGRVGSRRDAVPRADNVDRMCYELARQLLADEKRLTWQDCPEDVQRVEIGNYRALLIHGDEIGRGGFASPMTIVRHADRWRSGSYPWEFRDVYCVDTDTEALTPDGWRTYDRLDGLPIATLNEGTGAFEWQTPSRLIVKRHTGPMIYHHGRSMDHFATPDHDMWVAHKGGSWGRRKAADVPASGNWRYRAAADDWVGTEDALDLPSCLTGSALRDVAELVGWYVAEGHADAHQVMIAQDRERKPRNHQQIIEMFERLNLRPGSQPAYVRVCNTELAAWLRQHCGHLAPNKHLPLWAKNWPSPLLRILLDAAIAGDGHRSAHSKRSLVHYYTASRQLADDVQEVGLKLGLATGLRTRAPRGFGKLPSHVVYLSEAPTRTMPTTREQVDYDGPVWCPTVPNGLWFMRRNGRVMVTGNCGHYHTHNEWAMANGEGTVFQTGSTESDNRYARETMAASAVPSQRLHFVDPERGRTTAQYKVYLDAS